MSDRHTDCARFEDWLLDSRPQNVATPWHEHLESCVSCREQWAAHQALVAVYAGQAVPELSPSFEAGLDQKLQAAIRIEPVKGWRLAALAGYALAAVALMRWILVRFPLPTVSIDTSSPWLILAALIAAPLTLWLTATATRLLPAPRAKSLRLLTL